MLTEQQKIVCKIDWYSAIFNDMSFRTVLEWLQLDRYVTEFCENVYEQTQGLELKYVFNWRGVRLETSQFNFYNEPVIDGTCQEHLFDKVIPKIRLDISGSGLDNLRAEGVDVDTLLRTRVDSNGFPAMPMPSHVTRIDFAFDLINYQPFFLDKVITYAQKYHTSNDRVLVCSTDPRSGGGLKYSIRTGSQKTIYIGGTTSERMLRIYDKRLQYTDPSNSTYIKDNPYDNPDSWIRIELQTRRKTADSLCFPADGNLDPLSVFKYIFEKYAFVDPDTTKHCRAPVEFWKDLFDWSVIPSIIQTTNFVQSQSYVDVVVGSFFTRGVRSFLETYSILGPEVFWTFVQGYLDQINDISTPERARRKRCIVNRLVALGIDPSFNAKGFQYVDGNLTFEV